MNIRLLKTGLIFAMVILLMAFTPASRLIPPPAVEQQITTACDIKNKSFKDGEAITYKLYYNWNFVWFSAGEVTFKVAEHQDQYHLSAHGATYKSYEWFYKVDDKYDTYVNKETLLPEISIRDVEEGKYRLYDKITFDQEEHKAFSLRGKTKEQAEIQEYDLNGCMHDILSIIYYTRNLNYDAMSNGSIIPVKIFMDKEEWPLKVRYLGKEKKKKVKGLGVFNTIKFSPEVILGDIFTEDSKMYVWATDDENRIPLVIESPISVGSVKAVLKDYKELRYDLDSAVKLY
ncbi:MAG: DUF3108 domain-containing protein [Chitinophagales bacterium]|nr:DUF3108 domain-containing protein [Chitinophagales bacterium]